MMAAIRGSIHLFTKVPARTNFPNGKMRLATRCKSICCFNKSNFNNSSYLLRPPKFQRYLGTLLNTKHVRVSISNQQEIIRPLIGRYFHVTPRNQVHPIILIALKQVYKLTAIITGRAFRKWWRALPADKQAYFSKTGRDSKWKIFIFLGSVTSLCLLYYVMHIQETAITHRKRYVAFTPEQSLKIAQFEFEMHHAGFKNKILPPSDPTYLRIVNVAQKIVNSNQDLPFFNKQNWTVYVVDDPQENAFVLPTGHIVVFTGLMNLLQNNDELANVLAHEMSHALLGHSAEQLSHAQMLEWLAIVVLGAIWAIMPSDGIALVSQWFFNKVVDITLSMPYSRKLEAEADEVGMELCAKACFDVRWNSTFWRLMNLRSKDKNEDQIEFLSTHPNHENRADMLDEMLPKALRLRELCQCPPLSQMDPRTLYKKVEEEYIAKKKKLEAQVVEQVHGRVISPPKGGVGPQGAVLKTG